ncbi:MAG TPA: substrate-binding domain-containing protein [Bryobacteraceae bacterium]|nr:substrate-binding domain-containing protein [Bryobacteraceae bacterium]
MLVENRAGNELTLGILILIEIAVFTLTGPNFFSSVNAFEIVRLGVELGLLALALTPVIVTGGIDLSVGSMMGLCAVAFGYLWRDLHFSIPAAAFATLLVGIIGGALNAFAITRLGGSPLIVTLATYSLFRGIAEGLTRGVDNFSQFPSGFLYLGQGYIGGVLPAQTPVFVAFAAFGYLLLHRGIYGRAFRAIGYAGDGARWAGIPVDRRLALVYVLSGFTAAAASLIYVAHLGQARADAGTGYELLAITAVVLGGADIAGGRGSIWGTLLGLCAIVVLQNGLRVSAFPAELAGILTSAILVATIAAGRFTKTRARPAVAGDAFDSGEEMRNSQLAVLCGVIIAGSLIVAGSNWWLVKSVRGGSGTAAPAAQRHLTLGVMPKAKGDPYFVSCRVGAEEAAKELGVDMIWDGPTDIDPAKQNEVVEAWITRGVDSIAISVVNGAGISGVLRKARAKGIKVLTWDADAEPDSRDFFINQATPQGLGDTLGDEANRIMGGSGDFAIITGALTASNQNEWIKYIKARIQKYPNIHLITVRPSDDDRNRAFTEAQTLMKVYPQMKLIMAISAPAVPGAAEAVKQSGRTNVKVTGLSLPNMCKPYVKAGIADSVVLWNTANLGYLVVNASREAALGTLHRGVTSIEAGRLGRIAVEGDQVLLGKPLIFTKANIDQYDF